LSEKQLFNELLGESEYVKNLESRIADLESILDELPKMTELFQAVQEIQDQYEKPAMTFSHYLRG
jgi:superfamily I DNA/RNA helicase